MFESNCAKNKLLLLLYDISHLSQVEIENYDDEWEKMFSSKFN